MKAKRLNISFTKSGSNSLNSRIMLPITWVRELGFSKEEKEVYVYQIGDEIVIRKTPLIFNKKEAAKIAFEEINKIVSVAEYIDYDDVIKIIFNLLDCYFLNDDEKKNKLFSVYYVLQENLEKKYDLVIDEKKEYYFDKTKHSFSSTEELEKFFGITRK